MATAARSARSEGSRAARPVRRKVFGSETPRIFTPPLRELTEETTLGFMAIRFAVEVCGVDLYPWQRWLLIHALELDTAWTVATMHKRGRLDPLFRFRKVIVLVARQNGKSTLSQVLSLFFLYVLGTSLILGTAQDLDTAEEVWEGALDIIEETSELAELADKPIKVNGKKTIRLKTGERYKVKAANRRAGRGLSGDLILLDELREHQSWDAWAAITKTTMARPAAQIWALSNAGDASSIVLRYLRKQAHAALGDPDGVNADDDPESLLPTDADLKDAVDLADDELPGVDLGIEDLMDEPDTLGLFEWSAKPGADVMDLDGILAANPSCNYGISLRTLLGDAKGEPEWIFRTECLCQWSDGSVVGPFPSGSWEAGHDPESRRADGARVVACVDVAHDRTRAHVGIAAFREDGAVHVEVVASRPGTDWLAGWFTDPEKPHRKEWPVAIQQRGAPASALIEPLTEAGVDVVPWGGSDLTNGCGRFFDLVHGLLEDGTTRTRVFHRPSPRLDIPASTAVTRPLQDGGWIWDRTKSPTDVSPLVTVTGATWLLTRPEEVVPVSAYESAGVMTI